jgi:hypothetical protein
VLLWLAYAVARQLKIRASTDMDSGLRGFDRRAKAHLLSPLPE